MKKFLPLPLCLLLLAGGARAQTCTTTISTYPYVENFEGASAANWVAGGTSSSWALGTPAKPVIIGAASGTKAWTTNLTAFYNSSEQSQVLSPCFNTMSLIAPVIEMKVWWNSEFSWDGAVLQSSIDNGTTWQNVGAMGDPNNWYNDNTLNGGPGGQAPATAEGWTGRTITSNGSGSWVTAKHVLTGLGGKASVRFRIAFGSDPSVQDDGFAFDDFSIYESPANDLELLAITAPAVSGCGFTATETVTVSIKNQGTVATTSFPVSYQVGTTGTPVQETANLVIAPGATGTYSFTNKLNLATAGTYPIIAKTLLTTDGNPNNDTKTKTVTVVPSISTYPYFQNFEAGNGGWLASGTNSSWALGTPAKTVINSAASGVNSWVTNLTGTYSASEASFVTGPCFNLSSVSAPLIEMKVWWNSEAGWDGAALQSSIDGGATWQLVGAFGDPDNWYNDNSLDGRAGGQDIGWAGRNTDSPPKGSAGWVTAKHALTGLGGNPSVRLRIAFGADGSVQDDGFAFDDVAIYQTPANDVGVIAITSPTAANCGASATETVCVTIKNFGTSPQTSIPVTYQIGTNPVVTETFTGTLAPNTTATYCFTAKANLSAGGTFNFNACTGLASDNIVSNNCTTKAVTIINPIAVFPYIQDFETATTGAPGTLPTGWTVTPATSGSYAWFVNAGPTGSTPTGPNVDHTVGSATGKYVYTEASNGADGAVAELITPCLNLTGLTSPGFDFWYHMAGPGMGVLEVQVSNNSGTTWTTVQTYTGPQQTAETDPWLKKTVSLAAYLGQTIKIRFKGTKSTAPTTGFSYEGDMAIDDFKIYNIPTSDAEVTLITLPNSGCGLGATETICITVKNNSATTLSNIPVNYTINGGTPVAETVSGPLAPGASVQYCFTTKANLSANGTYTIVGRVLLAGDGDPSNDTKTGTISKVPTVSTLPYTEGFENGNGGWIASGSNSSWVIGTPAKPVINTAGTGIKSWVTGLTGTYNASEASFVTGPCFNFTGVADPDFEMKAWWSSEGGWDGAALQSSIDGGATWQLVGALGDPNNWYNDNSLDGRAGGQDIGWAGTGSTSSGGWVRVKHKLNGLGNKSSVRLRIAFGADASVQYDGFAFDDIRIGDNTNNLAVNSIVPLTKLCGFANNEPVTAILENLGSIPATGFTVSYTINGGTPVTQTYTGTLAPNSPTNFTFSTPANLSAAGSYTIVVTVTMTGDPEAANNTFTYTVSNATFAGLPPVFNFEPAGSGVAQLRVVTKLKSNITEGVGASSILGPVSTKGMIMDGIDQPTWITPGGVTDPWTNNPDNFSAAYICFNPSSCANSDSMKLTFDLKQLYKTAAANTNFRVTVNGTQVGPTHRPPFDPSNPATPIAWKHITVDLSTYKNQSGLQIGLESSVKEAFASGTGPANLIDNIMIRCISLGVKENALASQVNVFPNPSNGLFNVSLPAGKTYSLEVMDLTGKLIQRQNATGDLQLKLDNTAKGIYLLKVTSEGATTVRKLIVE
jgi:hypothetical protein